MVNFNKISSIIKSPENKINKTLPTIGGRWTVDTWVKNKIHYSIMDEGYTERLFIKGKLDVYKNYDNTLTFIVGDSGVLNEIYENIRG